ncbi:MAG: replication restart helicase PriA [Acidobacteriota bacterium]
MKAYAQVVLPLPLYQSFTYLIPENLSGTIKPGEVIRVPFRRKEMTGVVVGVKTKPPPEIRELKQIYGRVSPPLVFPQSFLSFARSLSEYFFTPWGEILQAALPPEYPREKQLRAEITSLGKKNLTSDTLTHQEINVLSLLNRKSYSVLYLKRKLKRKDISSLLHRMAGKNLINLLQVEPKVSSAEKEIFIPKKGQLEMSFITDDRIYQTWESLRQKLGKRAFLSFLLQGSSKDRQEGFLFLASKAAELGQSVLFLLPEVTAAQSFLRQVEMKTGMEVVLFHSKLSRKQQNEAWWKVFNNPVSVVVGTRSALLAPLRNLGLIIVDREHDDSHYQRELPSYDARKGAWLRAEAEKAVLIYGSDIPRVESWVTAEKNKCLVLLPEKKSNWKVRIIESGKKEELISRPVQTAINKNWEQKEKTVLFFNRLGYASFLFCPHCRHVPRCPECHSNLSYQSKSNSMFCPLCEQKGGRPARCPRCGGSILVKKGPGIEAVQEELLRIFPGIRSGIVSSERIRKTDQIDRVLKQFAGGKFDILLGTELLARRKLYSPVSLVVVIFPEVVLGLPDFRAGQRMYRTLIRLSSFLKDEKEAELVIQTALPEHYVLQTFSGKDYSAYIRKEKELRRLMNYPPYSHMVQLEFQGRNPKSLAGISREFISLLKQEKGEVDVLGPSLIRPRSSGEKPVVYVLLRSKRRDDFEDFLRSYLEKTKVKVAVTVYN